MIDSINSSADRSAAAPNSPEATYDNHVELGGPVELDEMSIRGVMSELITGVTIIATEDEGEAYGFACQSFSFLSPTPPMVLFTVVETSRPWPHIWNAERSPVNVSAEDQEDISAAFGRSNGERSKMGKWTCSELGNPSLHGCSVWIDCIVVDTYEGGDHWIVMAGTAATGKREEINPFIYHRGSYARVSHSGTGTSVDQKWCQRPPV